MALKHCECGGGGGRERRLQKEIMKIGKVDSRSIYYSYSKVIGATDRKNTLKTNIIVKVCQKFDVKFHTRERDTPPVCIQYGRLS